MKKDCPPSFHAETIFSVSEEEPLTGRTTVSSKLETRKGHNYGLRAVRKKDRDLVGKLLWQETGETNSPPHAALDFLYDRKTLFIPAYCCTHVHPCLACLFPVFQTVSKCLYWQDLPKQGSCSTRHSYSAIIQLCTSILLSGYCFHMTCSS